MSLFSAIARRALFTLEPETAHRMAITALGSGLLPPGCRATRDHRLATDLAGLIVPNPVGVAAGFDKDAEVPDALLRMGFGFTEIGTVTPLPQTGNPQPRVFRLPADQGVINRLGFNNGGHDPAFTRLCKAARKGIIGVNIGANKDADDRVADYVEGLERFHALAGYFTVNISSPNTPGLRDLQGRAQLADLLGRLAQSRAGLLASGQKRVPIFLKIAPDVAVDDLPGIVAEVHDNGLDGMIVSNTTLSRSGLTSDPGEAGGLSGRPVFERSTIMLAKVREIAGPDMTLIGVGGVWDGASALAKIEAGAHAVQLYTGMIYEGPRIASAICKEMVAEMDRRGLSTLDDIRGTRVTEWANRPLP